MFVGAASGLIAVAFQASLYHAEALRVSVIGWIQSQIGSFGMIVPMVFSAFLGSVAVYLTRRYAPEASGSGIPHLKGVLMNVRKMNWIRILLVKFTGGLLAIGAGFSLGREGPTVQMGAAAGKMVSMIVKARPRERKHLLACGAGAGLAAAFNAPLAGFIFVIEELQRDLSPITYGTALIASVMADIMTRTLIGEAPAFHLQGFPMVPLIGLPYIAVLGVLVGYLGALFNRSLLYVPAFYAHSSMKTTIQRTALVGALVGLGTWFIPLAVGSGHGTVETILAGQSEWTSIVKLGVFLLLSKWCLTVLSYGTGLPGGIFAPMLVLGAITGVLFTELVTLIHPAAPLDPSSVGLIGMAAFFTATVRAPLTGIILILEMTGNYHQLFPLLVVCMTAYITSERLRSKPIYDALLEADLQRQGVFREGQSEVAAFEVTVEPESRVCGKQVHKAGFPNGCLLISIKRGHRELIPHGSTIIEPGDELTLVVSTDEPDAYGSVLTMCRAGW